SYIGPARTRGPRHLGSPTHERGKMSAGVARHNDLQAEFGYSSSLAAYASGYQWRYLSGVAPVRQAYSQSFEGAKMTDFSWFLTNRIASQYAVFPKLPKT